MRFCRRCEGTGSARAIFKKAREDERSSFCKTVQFNDIEIFFWVFYQYLSVSDIYVAAALMEYFCSKDKKIASNIFELAFKKYKKDVKFISHYLDFLVHLNGNSQQLIRT